MPEVCQIPDDARLIRLPAVEQRTCQRKTKIYEQIRAGKFPRPVRIGKRAVAWWEHEITAYNASHPRA